MAAPPARPAVIRTDPLGNHNSWSEWLRALPVWIASAGLHAVLILFFWMTVGGPGAEVRGNLDRAREEINTRVEPEEQQAPQLTNIFEGLDPDVPPNYDTNRIGEVPIPGRADPNAEIGIPGGPEGPPFPIPPPPGSGPGQIGTRDSEVPGIGVRSDDGPGGYRGVRNVAGGLGNRSGATREKTAMTNGGSKASEAAVGRGLRWLALHQAPEGHWSLDQYHLHCRENVNSNRYIQDTSQGKGGKNDTAGAAFGLLPFLAAGITHKSSGRPQDDQYVKTVQRALNYLIAKQGKDGSFPGGMYAHGIATIALCEAFGLTADPALKKHAQAALNYTIAAQDPAGGGWRYAPRAGGDTSVVGWHVMALKSGQMSGLHVPQSAIAGAEKYLNACESADGGGYGYVPGSGETPTMTAVGLLCRQYLGTPRRNPGLRNGVEKLLKSAPPSAGQRNIYCEYYATQVMHHMQGEAWNTWNGNQDKKGMRDILIDRQERDGSWGPRGDAHSGAGGRIMQTSLSLLTLEVYYRHLPLYQRVDTRK